MLVGKEKYQKVVDGRSLRMPAIRGGIIEISRGKINGRLRVEAPTEQYPTAPNPRSPTASMSPVSGPGGASYRDPREQHFRGASIARVEIESLENTLKLVL